MGKASDAKTKNDQIRSSAEQKNVDSEGVDSQNVKKII